MSRPYKRELEYLESTGTQKIDTGITFELSQDFSANVRFAGVSTRAVVVGSYYGDTNNAFNIEFYPSGGTNYCRAFLRLGPGSQLVDMAKNSLTLYTPANVSLSFTSSTGAVRLTVNGTNYDATGTVGTYTANGSVCLFLDNRPNPVNIAHGIRMYSCSLFKGGVLVRDFIPVLDNDDTPCMYDKVSGQCFYNVGTGAFIYGELPANVITCLPYTFNLLGLKQPASPLTLIAQAAGSTVTLTAQGSLEMPSMTYRTSESGVWLPYTSGTTLTLTNVGDYVQFWNRANTLSSSVSNSATFSMTGTIAAYGSIQSMVNYANCSNYCFYGLFDGCKSLIRPCDMPCMQLAEYCYYRVFAQTNITSAPALPATTLYKGCYHTLFYYATNLSGHIILPAETLVTSCYDWMFAADSKITSVKVGFTSWAVGTHGWMAVISSSTGTFIKPEALSEERGADYIPTNWAVVNY